MHSASLLFYLLLVLIYARVNCFLVFILPRRFDGAHKHINYADLSVVKALTHAAIATRQQLRIEWIDASELITNNDPLEETKAQTQKRESAWERIKNSDGVVVPGGFGSRGIEGKIAAIQYARENKVPCLGICLGMQCAVIEYARNVLNKPHAHSAEFVEGLEEDHNDIVVFMPEGDRERMGGTMRLGSRETCLKQGSLVHRLYGNVDNVWERHRHRYEVNPGFANVFEKAGLHFVGRNTDGSGDRMEVIELEESIHPYFVGAQYHPEFTSRPQKPNPLFLGLMKASQHARLVAGKTLQTNDPPVTTV